MKRMLIGAALIGLALVACLLSLSYAGFCFSQRRFLADSEYVNAAVDRIFAQRAHQLVVRTAEAVRLSAVTVIPYQNRDEFFDQNPDCCRVFTSYVGDEFVLPGFFQKLRGRAAANIIVRYTVNYTDENGVRQKTIATSRITVSNCGMPVRNY